MGLFGKEKGGDEKKESRKSMRKSVKSMPPQAAPPVLPPQASGPTPSKQTGTGYSKDLDLEEKFFKPIVNASQQKEDICFYMMMRMMTATAPSKRSKFGFFEKGASQPVYAVFTTKNLHLIDAASLTLTQTVPATDIREVIVEVTENGQVTLELTNNTHMYFLASPDIVMLNDVLESFHRGAKLAQDARGQSPFFVSQRTTFAQSYIERSHLNQFVVKKILTDLEELGFTENDLWYGCVDLRPWIKRYLALAQPVDPTQTYVIEFLLPGGGKSYFKFVENMVIKKVIQTVSVSAKQTADKLALAPVDGCEMNEEDTLGSYGLGILFDTWQLAVIEKGSRKNFQVTVELPNTPEFGGNKVLNTTFNCHTLGKDAVQAVCALANVGRSHRFGLTLVHKPEEGKGEGEKKKEENDDDTIGGVVEDTNPLSAHGLCTKYTSFRLIYKFFPVATGNKKHDTAIVKGVILDMLDDVMELVKERKKRALAEYLHVMIKDLADLMIDECKKAKTVTARVAALNNNNKNQLYKVLDEYESEEVALFGITGQRRLMERARDFIWNNIPPLQPLTAAPRLPPLPPLPPPKPQSSLKKTNTITQIVETTNADGTVVKTERTVTIGGGFGGPPTMLDLLNLRKKLRPVQTRDGGWDKSNANLGIDFRKESRGYAQNARPSIDVPMEAIELYLKLKRRQEAIEKAMAKVDEVEDLGD